MHDLTSKFLEQKTKLSDKWTQYLSIYESELADRVAAGRPMRLLEIGVQNGGSLEVWKRYLPEGSEIWGLDIEPGVGDLKFAEGIHVHVLDATDAAALDAVLPDREFDVIVDDGSHLARDIITTLELLYPRLASGGKYFIEDLHASYWTNYGGGFRAPQAPLEHLKRWIDGVNADHIPADADIAPDEREELRKVGRSVGRIGFYDSVAVIEKPPVPKLGPHPRIFSGRIAEIYQPAEHLLTAPLDVLRTIRVSDVAGRAFSRRGAQRLQAALARVAELEAEVAALRAAGTAAPG